MKRTYEKSSKPVNSPVKPTTLNLQTRGFAPPQTDLDEEIPSQTKRSSSENLLEKLISTTSSNPSTVPIQRKSQYPLKAFQAKSIIPIQAKLSIGEPNDKYEQAADATASKVVQQINSLTQEQSVQREAEEELQMESLVQRRENLDGGEASTDLESSIQSARGGGQSLDANLQQSMGQAMGADFSGVKVHTDSQSDQLNKSIQAKAFTTGQDVFFRQGAYEPSSQGGQELIAHELTHVVQQNGKSTLGSSPIQRKMTFASKDLQGELSLSASVQGFFGSSSTFAQIQEELTKYETVNKANKPEEEKEILKKLRTLAESWIAKHDDDPIKEASLKKMIPAINDELEILEKPADEVVANENLARGLRSAEAEHFRLAAVSIIEYCTKIDDMIAVLNEKEFDVSTWKTKVQAFSAAQVLVGAAVAAVGIAACVVTLGAAAVPLSIALGVAAGVAGLGSGVSKAGLEKTNKTKAGAKTVMQGVAAKGATHGLVEGVGALGGAAAQETTKLVIGPAGGLLGVGMGAKSLYDMSNVDPKAVYSELEFDELNIWLKSASIKMHTYYTDHKAELNNVLFRLMGQKIMDTLSKLNTYKG